MHIRVLPAVPQVRFVTVEDDEAALVKDPEPLRRLAIVLVDLRQPARERIDGVEDRMVRRQFDELRVREDPPDLATEALVQPIVVIRMQEAAQEEVPPQRRHLLLRQTDVPVTGEVEVRVVKEPWVGQPHVYWAVGYGNPGALPDGAEQVRQAGRVRVPVPAAVVLDLCYGERRALFRVRAGRGRGRGRWRPL